MFYTSNNFEVVIPEHLASPGLKLWRMVELPEDVPCFLVRVRSCTDGETKHSFMLLSQLSDVLALKLCNNTQVIEDICFVTATMPSGYFVGRIKEIWVSVDMLGVEHYLMEDGTEWTLGDFDDTFSSERFRKVFALW